MNRAKGRKGKERKERKEWKTTGGVEQGQYQGDEMMGMDMDMDMDMDGSSRYLESSIFPCPFPLCLMELVAKRPHQDGSLPRRRCNVPSFRISRLRYMSDWRSLISPGTRLQPASYWGRGKGKGREAKAMACIDTLVGKGFKARGSSILSKLFRA